MPLLRQQPTTRNRRKVTRSNPSPPDDLTWLWVAVLGNDVQFTTNIEEKDCVIQGLPDMFIEGLGQCDAITSFVSASLVLHFPGVAAYPCSCTVRQHKPGIRTRWGGWMAAGQITMAGPSPTPPLYPEYDWTVTENLGLVDLVFIGGPTVPLTNSWPQLIRDQNLTTPVLAAPITNGWQLTYSTPVAPGETFTCPPNPNLDVVWTNRGWPLPGTRST